MTRVTVESDMSFVKREARLRIVIETPHLPSIWIMAAGTRRSEAPQVDVALRMTSDAIQIGVLEARAPVALIARGGRVESEKRKRGKIVIERDPNIPSCLRVASMTVRTLLTVVNIVDAVTTSASRLELLALEDPSVADLALRLPMRATQRKLRACVVVERRGFPTARAVAAATLAAATSPVDIVHLVAGMAVGRKIALMKLLRMTRLTLCDAMATFETEFRIAVVIEARLVPTRGRVTGLAARAESSPMHVCRSVAESTLGHRILVAVAGMTERAVNVPVSPFQRVGRRGVIEGLLRPGSLHVARGAVSVDPALVRVVLAVTFHAGIRRLPVGLAGPVTRLARCASVRTSQSVVGEPMVEGLAAQAHYVRIPARVLRVATTAHRVWNLRRPAVKTTFRSNVGADFCVAVEA
jgi:hypothetical protein